MGSLIPWIAALTSSSSSLPPGPGLLSGSCRGWGCMWPASLHVRFDLPVVPPSGLLHFDAARLLKWLLLIDRPANCSAFATTSICKRFDNNKTLLLDKHFSAGSLMVHLCYSKCFVQWTDNHACHSSFSQFLSVNIFGGWIRCLNQTCMISAPANKRGETALCSL